jgi:hypothetical protein
MSEQPTRWEQLGALMTAMVALIVSGDCGLAAAPQPVDPIFLEAAPYGIYSRVARKLGVTPQHVRRVALGKSESDRVRDAILDDLRTVGGRSAYECSVPGLRGSKFGLYSEVARELGCTPQHVRRVANGQCTSARTLAALKKRAVQL